MSKKVEAKPLKDAVGNKLEVGDIVSFCDGKYSQLWLGRVLSFSPKTMEIRSITKWSAERNQLGGINRKSPEQVSLLSREMRDFDDIEVYLHYKRLAEED